MRRSIGMAALLALLLTVVLSGCDVLSEIARPMRPATGKTARGPIKHPDAISVIAAFFGLEAREGGTNTVTGPGTSQVTDKLVSGPFNATLPINIAVPGKSQGRVVTNKVKGTFIAKFNGTTNSNTDMSSLNGIGVLKFKLKALGTACFTMGESFTQHGSHGSGTFKSTGGTGGAATMRAHGTVTDTVTTIDSSTSKDKGKIHIHAKLHRPSKAASADCTALAAQLP